MFLQALALTISEPSDSMDDLRLYPLFPRDPQPGERGYFAQECNRLSEQLDNVKKQNRTLQKTIDDAKQKQKNLEDEAEVMKKELVDASQKVEQKNEEIKILTDQIKQLNERMKEKNLTFISKYSLFTFSILDRAHLSKLK